MSDGEDPALFAALMERLGADGTPAAAVYEQLRGRLIQYFRLHLPWEAEDLSDTVLDRLARRVHEGVAVANLAHYTLGIARFVLMEAQARQQRAPLPLDESSLAAPDQTAPDDDEESAQAACAALTACLARLDPPSAALIMEYYGADGAQRIRARRSLAARLGVGLNALRNRALRLRQALEDCMLARLGHGARDGMPGPATVGKGTPDTGARERP